ncbi:MAG TPA: efflux transporter outer membrane subunit [Methylomirabilota bacterium]|nr:efflux transporter outer membrane subunit [Methylomirabilota bacterium]
MRNVILSGLAALFLAGCAVGPGYQQPKVAVPAAFHNATTNDALAAPHWWATFNDPLLARLIGEASANNHDLRIAEARLREARALWREGRFDFAPTVRSGAGYERFQRSRTSGQQRRGELYDAGFDASWELDIWGAVRRDVEAARATVESVEASRDDILVALRAELAVNYLELRGAQALLAVAQRNATNQTQTLQLAEALREGGEGTQLDVARARSLLNATLASIPPLEAQIHRSAHRVAILTGAQPTALYQELRAPAPFPVAPSEIIVETPEAVLRSRPDIRAAERSLAAATARIGVEVAELFPRLTFSGRIGVQSDSVSGLGNSGAGFFGFGPRLSWAAFDLGRVRQRIKAADARAEAALAIYEQTVLLALEETENSLVSLSRERERHGLLEQAERAAAEAADLARQRYREGVADFLSVLDAERTLLALQEQVVQSRTSAAISLLGVYKSFAGGL